MKKIVFVIMLIFLGGLVSAVADLRLNGVNYSPAPAIPGRYVDLYVYIKNNSTMVAENSVILLDLQQEVGNDNFPFSLDDGINARKELGTIGSSKVVTVEYRLNIHPEALNGDYKIKIKFGDDGQFDRSVEQIITVEGRAPQLEIIDSNIDEAMAGEVLNINLTVRNVGYTSALEALVGLEEDRTVTSTGIVVDRDIYSVGASVEYINELKPAEQKIVGIKLAVNPAAEQRTHMVPITLRYKDGNANDYSVTRYIGIKVSQLAELDAVISDTDPAPYAGGTSELTVDLFNVGMGNAEHVVAELSSEIGELLQPKNFIGTLEDDDFDSFRTKIKINGGAEAGQYPVTLSLTYKTEFGEIKTMSKTLYIKVLSQQEAAAQPVDLVLIISVLVNLLFIGGWVYRKVRKKDK